jgi:trehalose 6-phosphate phosphatase
VREESKVPRRDADAKHRVEGGGTRRAESPRVIPPLLPLAPDTRARLAGSPLVVLLDVDGTLAPLAQMYDEAIVPAATKEAVAALVAHSDIRVALVTGRSAAVARQMVGVRDLWIAGNHGFEIQGPNGENFADPSVLSHRGEIATAVERLEARVRDMPGVLVENKTLTFSVHWRLADPAIVPRLREELDEVAQPLGLRITEGKCIFEVRPPAQIDKGTAVLALAEHLTSGSADASFMFAGDDVTDEDAIRALRAHHPSAVTVRIIGDGEAPTTAAEFSVRDTDALRQLLEEVAASRGGSTGAPWADEGRG